MSNNQIVQRTTTEWYRRTSPELQQLQQELTQIGRVGVIGGFVSDAVLGQNPRDVDLVIDADTKEMERLCLPHLIGRNKFGGLKLQFTGSLDADVWALKDMWGFRTRLLPPPAHLDDAVKAVFSSTDAVLVDMEHQTVAESGFSRAFASGEIDVVFERTPAPIMCVIRLLVSAKQYQLKLSDKALDFVRQQVRGGLVWKQLLDWQLKHYREERITQADWDKLLPSFRQERRGSQ